MSTYNRKDDLSSAFNSFWQEALNSKEDYYSKLTLKEFVHLKKAITNINNIITMLVTESFVKTLHKDGVISTPQQSEMLEQLFETHANTNGFDVEYSAGQMKIVAEVKCNIPVNEISFGLHRRIASWKMWTIFFIAKRNLILPLRIFKITTSSWSFWMWRMCVFPRRNSSAN